MLLQMFQAILLTSIVGSILTTILLLLKPVTKRYFGSAWQYYAWLTVLVVMMLPVTIKLPQTVPIPPVSQTVQQSTTETAIQVEAGTQAIPMQATNTTPFYNTVSRVKDISLGITDIICYIWLIGCLLILGLNIIKYSVFLRVIRKNSAIISCPQIGPEKITVRKTSMIDAPLMIGLFRSTLLLPDLEMTQENLNYILLHELTHYRRHDLLYKWFAMLVNIVHWFNPFIYIVLRQIDEECEISCDLSVVADMNEQEQNDYMNTILMFASQTGTKHKALTTAMASNKKQIIRRFTMIRNMRKTKKLTAIISVITACMLLATTVFASGVLANEVLNDEYGELPMTQFNGGIRTHYALNHSLEENVQHAFGVPYGTDDGMIRLEVRRAIPYYIDENGKKIESYYKGEVYYGVRLGWKENNEKNHHLICKTMKIEGNTVTVGFSEQALPYKDDKVINQMIKTQIAFELGIGYDNKFGGYDHTVFVNELVGRGIYMVEEVIEPQDIKPDLHPSMDGSYIYGQKILTKYDRKEKIKDIFNDKIEMPKNVDGNQGLQLGGSFTVQTGEILAIDTKETSKDLNKINWAIIDADTGETIIWMPNVPSGERWIFIPLDGMAGRNFNLKVSTEESGWCDFEVFTYITDVDYYSDLMDKIQNIRHQKHNNSILKIRKR